VVAVECDPQFEPALDQVRREHPNVRVVWGDALEVDLPRFDKVVSNLPFRLALPLTFRLLENKFELGVLIYQDSLAKRLTARVGEKRYCRIGVQVNRVADLRYIENVTKESFFPPPRVDCAIVRVKPGKVRFDVVSEAFFKKVLDYLFFRRDRSLGEVLRSLKKWNQLGIIEKVLQQCRFGNKSIGRMTPMEFGLVSEKLYAEGIRVPRVSDRLKRTAKKPWKKAARWSSRNRKRRSSRGR
jgi:16S rRNA (adenine1518-N6/adenine1519-N6)-dimethyltransferase